MEEEPLEGGGVGGAVRVGATVRRTTGPWTPAVHALLAHLAGRLPHVPRVHGLDERGREILDYLPGHIIDIDTELLNERQIAAMVAWARDLHLAVADFRHPGPWRFFGEACEPNIKPSGEACEPNIKPSGEACEPSIKPSGEACEPNIKPSGEACEPNIKPGPFDGPTLIGHNDIAPYNVCFDGDDLVGVFDWDLAGPTNPRSELAFIAWNCVPLWRDIGAGPAARRLTVIANTYGGFTAREILLAVPPRIQIMLDGIPAAAAAGDDGMANLMANGEPERSRLSLAGLVERIPAILDVLDP